MSDGTLLLVLAVPAAIAFGFGIWAGLGYPGLYDRYARTGRAPRESPLRWLLRGGRRPLTSDLRRENDGADDGAGEERAAHERPRADFGRGRRLGR